MTQIIVNGIGVEYETFGHQHDEPLLLIMGLGAQLIHWREEFCARLADRGHFVVRFDNRDAGHSEKFTDLGVPNMAAMVAAALAGEPIESPYTLDDMADDAFGVMDALGLDAAHLCGASMGGMVAQAMALNARHRVGTLTSIMSSTGNPELPFSKPEALAALLSPAARDRDGSIERSMATSKVLGSPAYRPHPDDARRRAGEAFDRSFYPEGVTRQLAAIAAHGNRRPRLEELRLPALVIHGKEDPLVPVEGGVDTHEALADSTLLLFDGMGHDLPEPLWDEVIGGIADLTAANPLRNGKRPAG